MLHCVRFHPQAVVTLLTERESRPGKGGHMSPTPLKNTLSLAQLDALAEHVDGAFVVVVKVTGGRYKRRAYLSVKPAENAARRAIERGESATVYLAELKPLYRLTGGEC